MSESRSITSGVAIRYANALFALCKENGALKSLQKDVETLSKLLNESNDFVQFMESPLYRRDQQELAISSIAKHLKLDINTYKFLCLLARKGRLFILPDFIEETKLLLDNERDEMGVEVVSAGALTKQQVNHLETKVSKLIEKKANIQVRIDKSLINGMIIKLGSKMIDTTTKSKLVKLQTIMKEVN